MSIEPRLGAGIRDYLPVDMIPRQVMFDTIRNTFELFGFVPLDTPGLEREEVLTGGDPNFDKQIFRARLKESDTETLALRFDLTVPLARVMAQYTGSLPRPFKRYQIGKVWRGEKPQAGRFREFVQCDADIVGSALPMADAEIIALMNETMVALGVTRFVIRVNNRKILNGLAEFVGFGPTVIPDVLRLIDKLDRFGWDNIAGELADKLSFTSDQLDRLKSFLDFCAESQLDTINGIGQLMRSSPVATEGISELASIRESLQALGVPDDRWTIDLSVARGLGYYTGPVFETVLIDLPSIGSVFSGGRYDDLVRRFGSVDMPATGASVGVDRLFAAMERLELVKRRNLTADALVLNFDPECVSFCQQAAMMLRRGGVPTEIYLGTERTLKGQLAVAVKQEYPVVVIIGENEKKKGVVQIKNMRARSQQEVDISEVAGYVRSLIDL